MTEEKIKVRQLGRYIGAQIEDIDLADELSESQVSQIRDALLEHELIVFRDQNITTEQHVAFGRRFGTLTIHPFSPNREDMPEVIVLDNDGENPPHYTDVWHADETFREAPPMGTILRSWLIPPIGGDTLFTSMTTAYEALSDRMKTLLDGLEAVHDFLPFRKLFDDSDKSRMKIRELEDAYPNPVHPLVSVHPETGRRVLYINPQFTVAIKDMKDAESRAIMDLLLRHSHVPDFQHRLVWETNTIIFWDNRSTHHYATHDYFPHRRRMERITLQGSRPESVSQANISAEIIARFGKKEIYLAGTAGNSQQRTGADRSTRQFNRS